MKVTVEHLENLWKRLGAKGEASTYFDMLRAQYEEPPRAYHTLTHVGWGLKRIDEIAQHELRDFRDLDAIEYAMWFHDAIMAFGREGSDDERRSADMAYNIGNEVGLPVAFLRQARRLILATDHMVEPEVPDEAILVDADLSILGADEAAFREYERRVRFEWSHVSDVEFREGRLKVLKRFQSKRRIFTTPYASQKWEVRARINIDKSMHVLATGRPWP